MAGRCIGPAHTTGAHYPYIVGDRKNWNLAQGEKSPDHHSRSTCEVAGYRIHAEDGEIGHVEDFMIDDETWAIRYLIVDTRNWWPGKKVLVSPQWIERSQLERVESLHQSFPRGRQTVAGIQDRVSVNSGL